VPGRGRGQAICRTAELRRIEVDPAQRIGAGRLLGRWIARACRATLGFVGPAEDPTEEGDEVAAAGSGISRTAAFRTSNGARGACRVAARAAHPYLLRRRRQHRLRPRCRFRWPLRFRRRQYPRTPLRLRPHWHRPHWHPPRPPRLRRRRRQTHQRSRLHWRRPRLRRHWLPHQHRRLLHSRPRWRRPDRCRRIECPLGNRCRPVRHRLSLHEPTGEDTKCKTR
jgi:hypothetical protein